MNAAAATGDAPEPAATGNAPEPAATGDAPEPAVVAKTDGGGDGDGDGGCVSSGSSEVAAYGAAAEDVSPAPKQSRHERKARKILSKLGLTPIPGVNRVVIRKTDDSMFVITNPEVFKNPKSDSYIVFGNWQVQDLNRQAQSDAARMFQLPALPQNTPIIRPIMMTPMMYDQMYGQIDYRGVDEKDVELICEQLQVDKFTAINSLRRNNNDIVNAIMELTQL